MVSSGFLNRMKLQIRTDRIDEFQDISPIQYRLIREWNRDGKELFVIGDPADEPV